MKWTKFGQLLAQARVNAGFAGQAELAATLSVRQQTVSRWEQGESRPRAAQVPALASALKIEATPLLAAAGYAIAGPGAAPPSSPHYALDLAWPADALPEDTFERFCTDLLSDVCRDTALVTRYGDRGHKQNGIDIDAIHKDGTRSTYQCKRHKGFGPAKIARTIAEHTEHADRKVILFSGLASPQARAEIKKYHDQKWELWDREDISRCARRLNKVDQLRLVDNYFVGQRLQLLGELEPSPWRRPNEFFAGMTDSSNGNTQPWTYAWTLVGRAKELDELNRFGNGSGGPVLMLVGNGGSGKTRLLKAVCDAMAAEQQRRTFFLPRDAVIRPKDFEALGAGPKLLVCDDAHDRDDLGQLTDYVADPSHQARLILSPRPYGMQRVHQQVRSLRVDELPIIHLTKLNKGDSEQLAKQALIQFGGDINHVERLAAYTRDCPLATVIGAQVLAAGEALPDFLIDESRFRNELMRLIVDRTVTGASSGLNETSVKTVLGAIALLQPIRDDDRDLVESLASLSNISHPEVIRILRRLHEASVLYKRGYESRLTPDLMGDFLVEEQGVSAEDIFDHVPDRYAEHILLNLGRLDWRKSNGETDQSHLLDPLWSRLRAEIPPKREYLRAVAAVAFYQPKQALNFARRLVGLGHADEPLAQIARNASINMDYLPEACELLWQLGQDDTRPTNQQPSHGIRVLSEMASPSPGKWLSYMEQIVEFGLSLLPRKESWTGVHVPLEFLVGALATEGHTTTSNSRAIFMRPFVISQKEMAPLRRKVINASIDLLSNAEVPRAIKAVHVLDSAFRFPMGLFGTKIDQPTRDSWNDDFLQTLRDILQKVQTGTIPSVVMVKLASCVRWHAQNGTDEQQILATQIMATMNEDLRSRTIRTLVDGWGNLTNPLGKDSWRDNLKAIDEFAKELLRQFSDPEKLYGFLQGCLREIEQSKSDNVSPHMLLQQLVKASKPFAQMLLDRVLNNMDQELMFASYAGAALAELIPAMPKYANQIIQRLMASHDDRLMRVVADAYARYQSTDSYADDDRHTLKALALTADPIIQKFMANALYNIARNDYDLAVELLVSADFEVAPSATHDYLMWISGNDTIPFDRLSAVHVETLLGKLQKLGDISDYWILSFLKKALTSHQALAIAFLKSRMLYAAECQDWSYRPIPWNVTREVSPGFTATTETDQLLRSLFQWAAEQETAEKSILPWFGNFIKYLFASLGESLRGFTTGLLSNRSKVDFDVLASVLREVPSDFIFTNSEFVRDVLRTAQSMGSDTLDEMSSAFYTSSISGIRHGSPGKPFPRDLIMRDEATKAMQRLGRFDPAYKLYRDALEHATHAINRQVEQGRVMNEIDESDVVSDEFPD